MMFKEIFTVFVRNERKIRIHYVTEYTFQCCSVWYIYLPRGFKQLS